MKIQSKLLTVGRNPVPNWVGKNAILKVTFPAAENKRINKGTKDNPDWQTVNTSWFQMEAWGELGEKIMDDLKEGDAFELLNGFHELQGYENENGDRRVNRIYKIYEYEKYPSRNE